MTRSPDKYLLFCAAMVQAYLAGRKTQTRRLVKPQPLPGGTVYYDDLLGGWLRVRASNGGSAHWWHDQQCPYGQPGQLIYGKETFVEAHPGYIYRADCETRQGIRWTPSIFMPREACRIRAVNTRVRVERIQEISKEDCVAEGIDLSTGRCPRELYRELWNQLNLAPAPLYGVKVGKARPIVGWVSFPWAEEHFDQRYPNAREDGEFRGKPLEIYANPYVWVIDLKSAVDGAVESCLHKG